jgi:hypothetical protein
LKTLNVPDDVIWETRLRSPTQIEKALGRGASGLTATLIESKSYGVKLARTRNADAPGEFNDTD